MGDLGRDEGFPKLVPSSRVGSSGTGSRVTAEGGLRRIMVYSFLISGNMSYSGLGVKNVLGA